ncbi:MMPL family transporter [Streptomyces sp. I05A-00742]|uniref:MMPL family transporter n=1 Tax=Streptomyces sp. I05A-00742 TaxID=2732853 RepID=UPI001487F2FA|nr:MMPL family transporter [Streptomyces sp. I05A-00742]
MRISRARADDPAPSAPAPAVPRTARHPRSVLVAVVLLTAAAAWFGAPVHRYLSAGEIVPAGAESLRAAGLLESGFAAGPPDLLLVARSSEPVENAGPEAAGTRLAQQLRTDPDVARVTSYWPSCPPALRAKDGRAALILVTLRGREADATRAAGRLIPEVTGRHGPLDITVNGRAAIRAAVLERTAHDQGRAELLVLPVVALLLLLAFRSAWAALLPVGVGVFAVTGSMALLRLLASVTPVSVYASNLGAALGFALAVDYSLFLVGRHREELTAGRPVGAALRTTMRTAGRAVAFSAGTVALSLAALLVFPHTILRSNAYGGITAAVLAAAGSLVLVPAALTLLGDRVTRLDPLARWRRAPGHGRPAPQTPGLWGRTALRLMRRPVTTALAVTAFLVLLATPFTQLRVGLFDDRVLPASSDVGRSGALLRERFDAGAATSPTTVVLPRFDARGGAAALDAYARRISAEPGVRGVETATGAYRNGHRDHAPTAASARFASARAVWLAVATEGEPVSPAGRDLARALRRLPAPAPVLVGGPGADLADVQHTLSGRLPWSLALIAVTMLALVWWMTGRPVLACKALLLNTLSLSATFGALVYVFQEGHFAGLLGGFTATGTTDTLVPVLVFCLAFGLSMDYEIILLARVCEEHDRGADTPEAVARGLDGTARQFVWAALIFAVVMSALATSGLVVLKVIGVGLALAVLLDTTVVRALLVPAVMKLAGPANWWAPGRRGSPGRGSAPAAVDSPQEGALHHARPTAVDPTT